MLGAEKKVNGETKLLELLQNDLRKLSAEVKKKFPLIKESCEEAIVKIRGAQANPKTPLFYVVNEILYPFVQGCETKDPKIVKICLSMIQRLITEQVVDQKAARCITDTLWTLMESSIEEVKLLQSVTLLLTTNSIVRGDVLAKNLVLCFRLLFARDVTTTNTAGATIRQLVSLVFERVIAENECTVENGDGSGINIPDTDATELRSPRTVASSELTPSASDAYLMFQDLVLLVNGDQPCWLVGITEMTRIFGLELLEMILMKFPQVFFKFSQFSYLLKERVCALVIKLFSPNIKYRNNAGAFQSNLQNKPSFAISLRLCRIVEYLVHRYQTILVTECEIFLSLLIKFLDGDKPSWQRAMALEVLHHLIVDPIAVKSICRSYDLKANTTKIFHDIAHGLGLFVTSTLADQPAVTQGIAMPCPATHVVLTPTLTSTPGLNSAQTGFYSKGVWYPLIASNSGQAKSNCLDMLDKTEVPVLPDSYGISVAYLCVLDFINSLGHAIESCEGSNDEEEKNLRVQLVLSSWNGILLALRPMIDCSIDEQTTDNLLNAISKFVGFCDVPSLETARDVFITAVCKASLPPQYNLTVFESSSTNNTTNSSLPVPENNGPFNVPGYGIESDYRHQVVAVGTPLPTASLQLGAHQGPVMLTCKNLQCMKALLDLAYNHGSILVKSWNIVLTTLQHLVWILRLKPSTGGSLKAGKMTADANAVITTAVMADLPVLSSMISRLFESSQQLNDVSLHHLIHALIQLSQEAMELAYSNREPSLFAVAKLLETGWVNLHRIEVFWRPLTCHLLEVCQHPHIRMREWGVEAITYLLKVALQHKYQPPLRNNRTLQNLILFPLSELSCVPHADVRLRQLECMLHVLHSSGETLCHGWPLVLSTIGAVNEFHGENLIRVAFQCLQLVVTDFLPVMPSNCLPLCVSTTAKFGNQTQELNISLTAVGLMWNISDYFFQNHEKLVKTDQVLYPDFPGLPELPAFDKLWMCLYMKLGELCVDSRQAVRKSAGQTLFSTISAHGGLLDDNTWQTVLAQILFPLLEKVKTFTESASAEKVEVGSNILIHHSRNTAQKQWAETQVMTMLGVAKVFETKREILEKIGIFAKNWCLFLEYLEATALSENDEVSLAALKAFQEVLYWRSKSSMVKIDEVPEVPEEEAIRMNAWQTWLMIGSESTSAERVKTSPQTQQFLTALMQIFPDVFLPVRSKFARNELNKLCEILNAALKVPPHGENAYVVPSSLDTHISHLQDGVLDCLELIAMGVALTENSLPNLVAIVDGLFDNLFHFAQYACQTKQHDEKSPIQQNSMPSLNFVPFSERAIELIGWLYERVGSSRVVIKSHVLERACIALRDPICTKYDSSLAASFWKNAITCFFKLMKTGLPIARQHTDDFAGMWQPLGVTLDQFLFYEESSKQKRGSNEEERANEAIDIQIIELIREEILEYYSSIPKDFIMQIILILNKGSMLSTPAKISYAETTKLRENLAKVCFETLLEFSLLGSEEIELQIEKPQSAVVGRMAVSSLLNRFQNVLKRFKEDDTHAGKSPLPCSQVSEVSFVLKAITTLVESLKKAPADKVGIEAWQQLIDLYPHLVNCITVNTSGIGDALKAALLQYHELLHPKVS